MADRRKIVAVTILALALLPSLALLLRYPDMPEFGRAHDDGVYFVCAKSIALGHGYRIESLPGRPLESKYPPLYSLYLAPVWLLWPHFPENLRGAAWFAWMPLPIVAALTYALFRQMRLGGRAPLVLAALVAINPVFVYLSHAMLSELFFTAWLYASLIAALRAPDSLRWTLASAGLAACACLTRTAAAPLLVVVPFWILWRGTGPIGRKARLAAIFAAVAGIPLFFWAIWSAGHHLPGTDDISLYYTDYLGFFRHNLRPGDAPHVLEWNSLFFLVACSRLVAWTGALNGWLARFAFVLTGFALFGAARAWRRHPPLALYSLLYVILLLTWHYPPNERFMAPLLAPLAAGLAHEGARFAQQLKAAFRGPALSGRVVAAGMAALAFCVLAVPLFQLARADVRDLPHLMDLSYEVRANEAAARAWVKNLPSSGPAQAPTWPVFSYHDPAFYLYTGRPACGAHARTHYFYSQNLPGAVPDILDALRAWHSRLAIVTPNDFDLDFGGDERREFLTELARRPGVRLLRQTSRFAVYSMDW